MIKNTKYRRSVDMSPFFDRFGLAFPFSLGFCFVTCSSLSFTILSLGYLLTSSSTSSSSTVRCLVRTRPLQLYQINHDHSSIE